MFSADQIAMMYRVELLTRKYKPRHDLRECYQQFAELQEACEELMRDDKAKEMRDFLDEHRIIEIHQVEDCSVYYVFPDIHYRPDCI